MDKMAKEVYEILKNAKCDLKIQMDGTPSAHVEMTQETNGEGMLFAILTMMNLVCEISHESFDDIIDQLKFLSKCTAYVKPESKEQEEVMNKIIENVFKNKDRD